jgi:signal transduction histidine kinase
MKVVPPHDFASNVFHDLSQPLTALHCSLELALLRDQTSEEFRTSVEAALQNAERLRQRLVLLRALSDADDPGDASTPLALDQLLQQLREDMLPLFESTGRSLELTCEPVRVAANEEKLMRGFFYLLEFLLRCSSPGHGLRLLGKRSGQQQLEIRIEGCRVRANAGPSDDRGDPDCSGELEIARRTFRAISGDLSWRASAGRSGIWMVRLPCVS